MEHIPFLLTFLFVTTTLLTAWFFAWASHYSKTTMLIMTGWLLLQGIIASTGFYRVSNTMPPRLMLSVAPTLLTIAALFLTRGGRRYLNALNLERLTILHVIRIPVEMVLLWLCISKAVPLIMTFEGYNFDIMSGVTAPVIYYFAFVKRSIGTKSLLAWNFLCIALLMNIVVIAVLSAPFPFQQLGFDQPNVAVLYFPFQWLPCFIVPVVLLSHLAAIRKLLQGNKTSTAIG
jgi:hypothetical protein